MAQIDSSIPLGVRPVQIESPVNAMAKLLQVQGMQQDQQMNTMKADEYRRGVDRQNRLEQLLGQGGDSESLRKGGFLKESLEVDKASTDKMKTQSETTKNNTEAAMKKIGLYRDAINGVNDAASAAQYMQLMHADPDLKGTPIASVPLEQALAQIPQDPAQFMEFKRKFSLGAEKFMADERQRQTLAETTRHNTTTEGEAGRHNRSTEGLQARGQNMADARSREANQAGRVPAGYRMTGDGSLEFIPGGPADPNAAKRAAPTEFQGKAGMFGNRAQEADRIITDLEGKYSPGGINTKQALGHTPLVGGGLEAMGNMALSDESQKAEQAQRDFVNAVLRLESGAAISQGEFDNARKQYFRQPGDAPAVVAQKAQNRKTAIQGLISNARPGAVEPAAKTSGPSVEDLLKKYGGK
jgi:hypothetical protein